MRTKKRGLATLLIIMSITFTIQGAWFESNPLGLKIKEIDDGEKDQFPYTLQVVQSDNKTISSLFYNNELIKIIGESLSKDEKTVTVTTYNEDMVSLEVVSVFQKGLPQSITTKSGSNMSSTLFRYERGQLVEKKEIVNGIMKHLITYWRNSDGSLALSREIRIDKENLVSFYTYESDQVILTEQLDQEVVKNTIHPSLIVTREYSVEGKTIETQQTTTDIEGNLTIEEIIDGSKITSLYHSNGTLLRRSIEKESGEIKELTYEYDLKGTLIHSTEINKGKKTERIERYYTNGVVKSITEFVDESPVKSTRLNDDGTSIVTLFEEERPYADVTYASDGKRVLSIEYRKEQ